MIILGLHDKNLQEHLLREINLTLGRTVEICQTIELIRSHAVTVPNLKG